MTDRKRVLVFKTCSDKVFYDLLSILDGKRIECLIQKGCAADYSAKYPEIKFIDIQKDSFYELPKQVMDFLESEYYDELYVPLTGESAYEFGNVISIVDKCNSRKSFFYNNKGVLTLISDSPIYMNLCIKLISYFYRLLGKNKCVG